MLNRMRRPIFLLVLLLVVSLTTGCLGIWKKTYKLEVTVNNKDYGTVEGIPSNADKVKDGTALTLEAKPKEGYEFQKWEGVPEASSTKNPLEFVVDKDMEITATFVKKETEKPEPENYSLKVTFDDEQGSVTGIPENADEIKEGTEVTLEAIANEGYKFEKWEGVPEVNATNNPLKITLSANMEITAVFAEEEIEEPDPDLVTKEFIPTADTHVTADWRNANNYGANNFLEIKQDPPESANNSHRKAFLKFDVGEWSSVTLAEFKLYAIEAPSGDPDIREIAIYDVSGTEWDESVLTWENAPDDLLEEGTLIEKFNISVTEITDEDGKWYVFDLTELVRDYVAIGISELSLRLEASTPTWPIAIHFSSKEADEAYRPSLEITGVE